MPNTTGATTTGNDDRPDDGVTTMRLGAKRIRRLSALGRDVLRYGLVFLLLFFGGLKFQEYGTEGVRPLVENHPLMSWMYLVLGARGTPAVIGLIEIASGVLIAMRRWWPSLSAVGSLVAAATFVVTVSFLFTTPGALSVESPIRGFLMKDLILLGAALCTAAEALEAANRSR
jgi:uncharacterized membrane protein YkgB